MNRLPPSHESDRQIAEGLHRDKDLECSADGCPNRWSVDGPNGRCCSAHSWSSMADWPEVTRQQLDLVADIAARNAQPKSTVVRLIPRSERIAILRKLSASLAMRPGSKQWAYDLKRQDEQNEGRLDNGLPITPHQRHLYQSITGRPFVDMETKEDRPF